MVSIRCFCGVGEFCKVKSIPCGTFTSNKGPPVAPGAAITSRIRIAADNRLSIARVPHISKLVPQHDASAQQLEQELQSELNETRICPRRGTGDYSEVCIVRRTTGGIRGRKLSPVEQVEELHAELHTGAPLAIEEEILESGDIEIVDPIGAQSRIDTRLIAEGEIRRGQETSRIKPAVEASPPAGGRRFVTSRQKIGTGASPEQGGVVGLTVSEDQRKSSLKCGYAIDAPTSNNVIQGAVHIGKKSLALTERKVQHVADYQPLRHVL